MKKIEGYTEYEILEIIKRCVSRLAPKFIFPGQDLDDMKQQGTLEALQVLETEKYDASRPLENFLYTHIHNRLHNFKRDNYNRNDSPCKKCFEGVPCKGDILCSKFTKWKKRNQDKVNVINPKCLTSISEQPRHVNKCENDIEIEDLLDKVDEFLPAHLRPLYLQIKSGMSVPKEVRENIERVIRSILEGDLDD